MTVPCTEPTPSEVVNGAVIVTTFAISTWITQHADQSLGLVWHWSCMLQCSMQYLSWLNALNTQMHSMQTGAYTGA